MWYVDPLLGNDREANNETTAIASQQLRKYTAVLEPLLGSGPRNNGSTVGSGVFYVVRSKALSLDLQLMQCSAVEGSELVRERLS
jgi:hypothetical protein